MVRVRPVVLGFSSMRDMVVVVVVVILVAVVVGCEIRREVGCPLPDAGSWSWEQVVPQLKYIAQMEIKFEWEK
jgi:hypothetical protein